MVGALKFENKRLRIRCCLLTTGYTTTFVVNIKFPWTTYHTIVPSTEELCCLIGAFRSSLWVRIIFGCQETSLEPTRKLDRGNFLRTCMLQKLEL